MSLRSFNRLRIFRLELRCFTRFRAALAIGTASGNLSLTSFWSFESMLVPRNRSNCIEVSESAGDAETSMQFDLFRGTSMLSKLQKLVKDKFPDRKSTRLNSSHLGISYAVFCL